MIRLQSEIFKLSNDTEAEFTTEQLSRFMRPSPVFSGFSILFMNNNEREESARHDNSRTALFSHVLMRPYSNADIIRTQDQIIRCQGFVNIFGVAVGSHAIVRAESFEEEIITPLSNINEEFGTYTRVTTVFPFIIASQAILNFDDMLMENQMGIYSRSNATIRCMTSINIINIANYFHEDQFLICIRVTNLLRAISLPSELVGLVMIFLGEEISGRLRFISTFTSKSLGYITNIIPTFHIEQSGLFEDGAIELPAIAPPPDIDRVERIFMDVESTTLFGFISRLTNISLESFDNISATVHQEQLESNACVTDEFPAITPLTRTDRAESVFLDEDITTNFGFTTSLTNISLEHILNTSTTVHQDQVELYAGVTDEFPAIAPLYHFTRLGRVFNEEEVTRNVTCISLNDISLEPEHIANTAVTVQGQQIELQTQITTEITSPSSLYDFVRPESIFMDEQITRNLEFVSVLTDIAADLIANIPASL